MEERKRGRGRPAKSEAERYKDRVHLSLKVSSEEARAVRVVCELEGVNQNEFTRKHVLDAARKVIRSKGLEGEFPELFED